MPTITLKAHFDGERIILDEPFDLPKDSALIVTLLPTSNDEETGWESLANESLSRAYGPNEPTYTIQDLKQQS